MKKGFFIILLSIGVAMLIYLAYEYYFITSVEAPMPQGQINSAPSATSQNSEPVVQPPETTPQYPTGFRGPTGMPFIKGPTEPPPGTANE